MEKPKISQLVFDSKCSVADKNQFCGYITQNKTNVSLKKFAYGFVLQDDSEICPVRNIVQEFKLPSEILNFKYDQTRYALEESGQDDDCM